jgi:hypothetical protein
VERESASSGRDPDLGDLLRPGVERERLAPGRLANALPELRDRKRLACAPDLPDVAAFRLAERPLVGLETESLAQE